MSFTWASPMVRTRGFCVQPSVSYCDPHRWSISVPICSLLAVMSELPPLAGMWTLSLHSESCRNQALLVPAHEDLQKFLLTIPQKTNRPVSTFPRPLFTFSGLFVFVVGSCLVVLRAYS